MRGAPSGGKGVTMDLIDALLEDDDDPGDYGLPTEPDNPWET